MLQGKEGCLESHVIFRPRRQQISRIFLPPASPYSWKRERLRTPSSFSKGQFEFSDRRRGFWLIVMTLSLFHRSKFGAFGARILIMEQA